MSETKANPQAPTESSREGIIDRLKATNTPDEILALVTEFRTFKNASDKTKRRFLGVLVSEPHEMLRDRMEEIRDAAQFIKPALKLS